MLRDLKPLGKYSFRFRAFNEAGSGAWGGFTDVQMPEISSPSEPVITNPIEPNEKYIKSTLAHQIPLKWTIPTNNGADIDKYIVKYCPVRNTPGNQNIFFKKITLLLIFFKTTYLLLKLIQLSDL